MTSKHPLEIRRLSDRRYTDHIFFKVEIGSAYGTWHLEIEEKMGDIDSLFGWWCSTNYGVK